MNIEDKFQDMPPEYFETIKAMHGRMMDWRRANSTVTAVVGFKFSDNMIIISTIRGAIMLGLVTVNEAGYEMIRAMCEPEASEPSVSMVQAAINYEPKEKK
jgi:hypothetical protein